MSNTESSLGLDVNIPFATEARAQTLNVVRSNILSRINQAISEGLNSIRYTPQCRGEVLQLILDEVKKLGYTVEWQNDDYDISW